MESKKRWNRSSWGLDHLTFEGGGGGRFWKKTIPAAPKSKKKIVLDKLYIMRHFSTGKTSALFVSGEQIIVVIKPLPSPLKSQMVHPLWGGSRELQGLMGTNSCDSVYGVRIMGTKDWWVKKNGYPRKRFIVWVFYLGANFRFLWKRNSLISSLGQHWQNVFYIIYLFPQQLFWIILCLKTNVYMHSRIAWLGTYSEMNFRVCITNIFTDQWKTQFREDLERTFCK